MTKQEFLSELRKTLAGSLNSAQVESHARYYEEYINAEIRKGKTEEEVLNLLGNPRLIARSIIDAENGGVEETNYEESREYGYVQRKKLTLPLWIVVLLLILTVLAVIGVVVAVIWWLAPIILVIWLIVFLIQNINKRK